MLSTIATVLTHPGWGPGPGFWFIPLIFWVLLLGTIVTLVLVRRRRGGWPPYAGSYGPPWMVDPGARSAEGVLAERFARGEIDEAEYRARLEVLRSQQPRPPQG